MKTEIVCGSCGRTISGEFVYCPWCGCSRADRRTDFAEARKSVEQQQDCIRMQRISAMGRRLDELEKELDILVLSSEMHK